ncbi:MAG: TRAP transporter large permease, partial [Actinobacteria bacterium]|nr:TRAP transporter large permease [Actinomycetota bacterium]
MAVLILVVFLLFILGVPITFALGAVSLLGLLITGTPLTVLVQRMFTGLDSFPLVAVPLFILAGGLMSVGGISRRLVDFAQMLVGHFTAGLAMVSVVAAMFFSAVTGSAIADTAAIGGLMIPAMIEEGYDRRFSAALLASAGSIGPIIPPSIPMVLYGVMASASIAELFMGGVVPGVMMGLALMAISYYVGRKRGYRGRARLATPREILRGLQDAVLAMLMPLIIIGGILGGVFTATESGVIAVVYALILGMFVYRELKLSDLPKILLDTAVTTGTVLIVIGTASLFTWFLTIQQIPQSLAQSIVSFTSNKYLILLLINVILLIVGTFIDTISALTIF